MARRDSPPGRVEALEDGDSFERLLLVNARHVKHVPGRKTDVKDTSRLCQLLEVGLLSDRSCRHRTCVGCGRSPGTASG